MRHRDQAGRSRVGPNAAIARQWAVRAGQQFGRADNALRWRRTGQRFQRQCIDQTGQPAGGGTCRYGKTLRRRRRRVLPTGGLLLKPMPFVQTQVCNLKLCAHTQIHTHTREHRGTAEEMGEAVGKHWAFHSPQQKQWPSMRRMRRAKNHFNGSFFTIVERKDHRRWKEKKPIFQFY